VIKIPRALCGNPAGDNAVIDSAIAAAREATKADGACLVQLEAGKYYYRGGLEIIATWGDPANITLAGEGMATQFIAVDQDKPVIRTSMQGGIRDLYIRGDDQPGGAENAGLHVDGYEMQVERVTISGTSGPMLIQANACLGVYRDIRLYRGQHLVAPYWLMQGWPNSIYDSIQLRSHLHLDDGGPNDIAWDPDDIVRLERIDGQPDAEGVIFDKILFEYCKIKTGKALMRLTCGGATLHLPKTWDCRYQDGAERIVLEPAAYGGNYAYGTPPSTDGVVGGEPGVKIKQDGNSLSIARGYCGWPDAGGSVRIGVGVKRNGGIVAGRLGGDGGSRPSVDDQSGMAGGSANNFKDLLRGG